MGCGGNEPTCPILKNQYAKRPNCPNLPSMAVWPPLVADSHHWWPTTLRGGRQVAATSPGWPTSFQSSPSVFFCYFVFSVLKKVQESSLLSSNCLWESSEPCLRCMMIHHYSIQTTCILFNLLQLFQEVNRKLLFNLLLHKDVHCIEYSFLCLRIEHPFCTVVFWYCMEHAFASLA